MLAWRNLSANICLALTFGITFLTQTALSSAAETLSVNTASSAPLATPRQDGYSDLIAIEVFERIGRSITIQIVPGERSLINLDHGIDDAVFVRISGMETDYPNVRMVPEKIMDSNFVAFTLDPNVKVKKWADLKSYSVAYINGWKIFEQKVQDAKFVTKVSNPSQLFDLLAAGRADVVLFEMWRGLKIIRERSMTQVRALSPPLAIKEMFMYVHKKHDDLVNKLATTIRAMKADGTFEKFYEQTLAPLMAK